jgi:hypothetical protein
VKSPRPVNQPVLAKLEALNLTALSEEERLSAVAEIRAQMADASARKSADSAVLVRKLALLKIWQKLVQMRIVDIQQNRAPPEVKPTVDRMFPPEPEVIPQEPVVDAVVEAPVVQPDPPKKRKGSALVSVKLDEESVIKGKTVASGEVVQVSRREANGLVEAGKGTVVD